uniref:Uncharacterized protein n=1 Tax=Sphaerodactylus townsendi TaxID=933632 RepID=A0ACB8FMZ5_9SAUR
MCINHGFPRVGLASSHCLQLLANGEKGARLDMFVSAWFLRWRKEVHCLAAWSSPSYFKVCFFLKKNIFGSCGFCGLCGCGLVDLVPDHGHTDLPDHSHTVRKTHNNQLNTAVKAFDKNIFLWTMHVLPHHLLGQLTI